MRKLWRWLGRAADGISIWQAAGSLGLVGALSWAATGVNAIAELGWGMVVFAGLGVACATIFVLAASLALYRVFRPLPPAQPAAAIVEAARAEPVTPPGSSLERAISAFLAKNGHQQNPGHPRIQIRDGKDGSGEYVAYWDQSLWPWPSKTVVDGFTADQLRMLPNVFPTHKTQAAKEQLGAALTKLSGFINSKIEEMVSKSETLRARFAPQSNMAMERGFWDPRLADADLVMRQADEVDRYFQEQPLLAEYPLFRAEIAGTLPPPIEQQTRLNNFKEAVRSYRDFLSLMKATEGYENNAPLVQTTPFIFAPIYKNLTKANSDLRDWITDCNRRIDMMMRAL